MAEAAWGEVGRPNGRDVWESRRSTGGGWDVDTIWSQG